jgi:hypothetical protein
LLKIKKFTMSFLEHRALPLEKIRPKLLNNTHDQVQGILFKDGGRE